MVHSIKSTTHERVTIMYFFVSFFIETTTKDVLYLVQGCSCQMNFICIASSLREIYIIYNSVHFLSIPDHRETEQSKSDQPQDSLECCGLENVITYIRYTLAYSNQCMVIMYTLTTNKLSVYALTNAYILLLEYH